jgi:hypothetical protein
LFAFFAVKIPLIDLFLCLLEANAVSLAAYGTNTDCLKKFVTANIERYEETVVQMTWYEVASNLTYAAVSELACNEIQYR